MPDTQRVATRNSRVPGEVNKGSKKLELSARLALDACRANDAAEPFAACNSSLTHTKRASLCVVNGFGGPRDLKSLGHQDLA